MYIQRLCTSALLSALLLSPAFAQTEQDEPSGERRRARRVERGAGQDGPRPERPGAAMIQMVERLKGTLELDEQQAAEFDKIVATYRERLTAQAGESETRDLMRQLREARQNGDDEQTQKLREQLRASTGGAREQLQGFFDDVEKILRDDQKEKLGTARERLTRAGGRMGAAMDPAGRIAPLRERLNLNERQAAKWDELFTAFAAQVAPPDGETDVRRMARDAEADPQQVREMREAMAARRERARQATQEFFDGLSPMLDEHQKQIVTAFQEEIAQGGLGRQRDGRGADRDNPRIVFQAARRIELTSEQRDQLKQIEQAAGPRVQEAGRNPEALAALKADVQKQIREILTPEQIKDFDAALTRIEARGARGGSNPPADGNADQPRRRRAQPDGARP
jgi:hypothetical protein